jgi:hypothetical protein
MDGGPTHQDETKREYEDEKIPGITRARGRNERGLKVAPGKSDREISIFARHFPCASSSVPLSPVCCSPLPCTTWSAVIHTPCEAISRLVLCCSVRLKGQARGISVSALEKKKEARIERQKKTKVIKTTKNGKRKHCRICAPA